MRLMLVLERITAAELQLPLPPPGNFVATV
jgi:hypothetical protein